MSNFAKGFAFFVFGVLLSPILFGMMVPMAAWELTENPVVVVIATVVAFSAWAVAREVMIAKRWHYHI